jgi:hypothetical protein
MATYYSLEYKEMHKVCPKLRKEMSTNCISPD